MLFGGGRSRLQELQTETMPVVAPNPFDEDTPMDRPSPEGGNPFIEEEVEGKREHMGSDAKRRGTLEKIAGLSPFWKSGKGLLGVRGTPEKRRGRRKSEDVSLLSAGRKKDTGCGEEDGGGPGVGTKRLSFLWLGGGGGSGGNRSRRESMVEVVPERNEVANENEKVREPLSVLEILHLIQQRELRSADQHIIELEAECDGGGSPDGVLKSPGRQAKDVTLLYEALMKEMWAVVDESLNNKGKHLKLDEVIGVIQQEEAREGPPGSKDVRRHWVEAVGRSVDQRLKNNLEGKMGSLPSQAERVKRTAVEDLTSVKNHLVCSYPKDFEVFRIYLSAYHRGIAEWLTTAAKRNLETNEIYFLLDWNSNVYCRDVLSRPEISLLINPSELGPLLSPEIQRMLEEQCVNAVQLRVCQRLEEELKGEQERWKLEAKNEEMLSNFSGRVIQIMKPHVDRAPGISEGFGVMMSRSCLSCFSEFLHSFQKTVEKYHAERDEVTETSESYICRVISVVNCCPPFREFAARMAQLDAELGREPLRQAESSLDRITGLCTRGICDLVLRDLKPCSRKLLGRRWLSSSEACDGMVSTLAERAPSLRKMSQGPYQVAVSELHRKVLLELVRPLVQGKMACTTSKTRKKVAAKLKEEARQLGQIFSRLESPQPSLDTVIPRLAEILVLDDIAAIQMEVGMLAADFPDFRKRHLSALLDVRGLWDPGPRHEILGVLQDLEGTDVLVPSRGSPGFFADILITRDTRCINVSLSRASQLGRRALSHLGRRQRSTQNRGLGQGEEDTQL
ncbi:exocyst complex component 3-like protein 2 isoform X2 [Spea bombifrons]|uniref:exocyst complex component 3-like protein 2 isoform X2 n=1 Tax=Spea bombifrons TaxID=233779 RepID=UPI00234B0C5C|nr:exocyst complex component 3-like protein 2 isoform X2 [Spea bombifrons]